GPGWRMYYVQRGDVLIVMLGGGDKPTPQSDEDIANYLTAVLEENDPDELPHALGVIARARRMQLTATTIALIALSEPISWRVSPPIAACCAFWAAGLWQSQARARTMSRS